MTLALYGKSRKRRAWLLAAALLAVVVAAVGGGTYLNGGTASATTCSNCAHIKVMKVAVNDPATTTFSATVADTTHASNITNGNVTFTAASNGGADLQFDPGSNPDAVAVTEGAMPNGNWTPNGWAFASYNEQTNKWTCPAANGTWTSGSAASGGSLASVGRGDNVAVCFKNTYTQTGTIQVHKYLPKKPNDGNSDPNAPWTNQGNGPSSWTFNIYNNADLAATHLVASGSQLGTNINNIPMNTDLWVTEANSSGYTLAGFYLPDGDGNSGNDKCNQQPSGGPFSSPLHILSAQWATKGNHNGVLHICAYNNPVPTTGTVIVKKVASGTGSSGTDSFTGDLKLAGTTVTGGHITDLTGNTPHTFNSQAFGSYSFNETDPGAYTLQGYSAGNADGNCNGVNSNFSGVTLDAQHTTAVICVYNDLQAETASQQVTFGKYVCNNYSDVQANQDGGGGNDVGPHVTDLKPVGSNLGPNDAVNPSNDGRTVADCHDEPWQFVIKDTINGTQRTVSSGTVTLTTTELATAQHASSLRIEEVPQTGYGFASIKCYTDHLNQDNWEWLDFSAGIPEGNVYCLAYNVPPPQQVTFTKYICPDAAAVPDTSATPVTPDAGGCTLAPTAWTFDLFDYGNNGASLGSVSTLADGSGSATLTLSSSQLAAAEGVGILVKEATPLPAGYTERALRCYMDNYQGGYDTQELIKLSQPGTPNVYCLAYNVAPPAQQQVTFIKAICPSFGVIPANLPVDGLGYGTNAMPAGMTVNDLAPASPAEGEAVGGTLPAECTSAAGWGFQLTGGTSSRTVTTLASGVTVTLNDQELAAALLPWHDATGYHGLSVSEVEQAGYGFGELKCYKDHHLLDNSDLINITTPGTSGVYCIAYNVPTSVTTFDKTDNLGEGTTVDAGSSFKWTLKITVSGSPTTSAQTFHDTIPDGFTVNSVTPSDNTNVSCSELGQVVTCTLGKNAPVGDYTVAINVTPGVAACGDYTNQMSDVTGKPLASDRQISVVNCTGTVVIKKIVEGGSTLTSSDPTPLFDGTFDGSAWPASIGNGGSTTINNVVAGSTHAISENPGTAGIPGDSAWRNDGFYLADVHQQCPTSPIGQTTLNPLAITVTGGQTTVICILNFRNAPQTVTGTVNVIKVVTPVTSATDAFTGSLSTTAVNNGGGTFSLTNGQGKLFTIGLTSDHPNATFTVAEDAKAGYVTLGYKLLVGGGQGCDPSPSSFDAAPTNVAIGKASNLAYTVCIYNQPQGSITINKVVSPAGDTGKFDLQLDGVTKLAAAGNGGTTGAITVVAGSHTVSEVASSGTTGTYTSLLVCSTSPSPIGTTSGTVTVAAGANVTCTFTNTRYVPVIPNCAIAGNCAPNIIVTPTPTTPPATSTKAPVTVTQVPTQAPTTATGTVEITLGEKTPGPGASGITPAAPSAGTGLGESNGSGSRLMLAILGIFALCSGLAIITLGRRGSTRS